MGGVERREPKGQDPSATQLGGGVWGEKRWSKGGRTTETNGGLVGSSAGRREEGGGESPNNENTRGVRRQPEGENGPIQASRCLRGESVGVVPREQSKL